MEIEHTNMCGLWMRDGSFKIKVWHLQDGDYDVLREPCSPLLSQCVFYQDNEPLAAIPLRVYWRVRPENRLLEVFGAIPKYDDPKSLECYLFEPIVDPATKIGTPESAATGDVIEELRITKAANGQS